MENFKGLKHKICSKLPLWNRNREERYQRGEGLYFDLRVWRGNREPRLGLWAEEPLKHQQAALPPWSEKASDSGREGGKVLSRVIPQTCWA